MEKSSIVEYLNKIEDSVNKIKQIEHDILYMKTLLEKDCESNAVEQSVIDKNVKKTVRDGEIFYTLDNKYHRLDGPAVIKPNGLQIWYCHGEEHREDGPAVITPNGWERWYRHGLLHRLDGPAVTDPFGGGEWWFNGELIYPTREI